MSDIDRERFFSTTVPAKQPLGIGWTRVTVPGSPPNCHTFVHNDRRLKVGTSVLRSNALLHRLSMSSMSPTGAVQRCTDAEATFILRSFGLVGAQEIPGPSQVRHFSLLAEPS